MQMIGNSWLSSGDTNPVTTDREDQRRPRGRVDRFRVLTYRNPQVVERYRKDYLVDKRPNGYRWLRTLTSWLHARIDWLPGWTDLAARERAYAERLFRQTMIFFAVCGLADRMVSPPIEIDDMWHTFLLFTRDYREFCRDAIGRYIDHQPFDDGVKDPEAFRRGQEVALRHFPEDVDHAIWHISCHCR